MTKRERPESLSKQLNEEGEREQKTENKEENSNSLSKLLVPKISDFTGYKSNK